MKILFIQEADRIGGNTKQQQQLAVMLARHDHEVRVVDNKISKHSQDKRGIFLRRRVTSEEGEGQKDASVTVIYPGFIRIPLLNFISSFFSHRREINKQIEEFKPEVIVGWGIINSYLAANVAIKNNIPFVYYWVDVIHLLIPNRLLRFVGKICAKRALKKSTLVLVINGKLQDYVISVGVSPDRTRVIRAGINLGQFNLALSGIDIRKLYGLHSTNRVLLFIGGLYHFYRLDSVIQALSKSLNTQLKLLIIGEGEAYDDLHVLRDRYRLGERVVFTGKKEHSEIPKLVAAADICILPADPTEPNLQHIIPMKMYEYMAMKKPVITTKLPGVMKEFGEGNGVVYVDQPKDVVIKAEEIFYSGYAALIRHGTVGRKFVEKYNWERVARDFETVLNGVIESEIGA